MPAAKLTETQKRFLVKAFAQYMTPAKVAAALAKEYGITLPRQGVERYNPLARSALHLPKRFREYFVVERASFEKEMSGLVTVQRAVRVRMREEAALHYEETRNYLAMTRVLNDIADEMGDVRTNKRVHSGPNGGPIQTEQVIGQTLDEMKAELAAILRPKKEKP